MSWKVSSPGTYERPKDPCDVVAKLLADTGAAFNREHWIISFVAHFMVQSASEKEVLKLITNAWVHLRHQHPFMAVVEEGSKLFYHVPDDTQLEDWLSQTVFYEEDRTLEEFLLVVGPKRYNTIHYFPKTSHVVVRAHHWLVDGMGGVSIMNLFFSKLAQNHPRPQFGDEWERLPPRFTDAAELEPVSTAVAAVDGELSWKSYVSQMPSVGLPYQPPTKGLGGTCHLRVDKGNGFVKTLYDACKSQAVSVTSAVHAAIAIASHEMAAPGLEGKSYTSLALFNYRKHMKAPYSNLASHPGGCYVIPIPFSISNSNFETQAREFSKVYTRPVGDRTYPPVRGFNYFTGKLIEMISAGMPEGTPLPSQPQLSSLGVLDDYIKSSYEGQKSVTVDDIELISDQMSAPIVIYQWSFLDHFHLSANYNEVLYSKEYMEQFLSKVFSVLHEGLKL